MSHRINQRNITSFFTKDAVEASRDIPSSPGPPSSLPSTPVKPAPRPRNAVIAASDDEDEGSASDDSLADLSTILGTRRPPGTGDLKKTRPTDSIHGPETPHAKRTALTHPSSPLTLNPKVHKFDIKAFARAARLDDAISASSARAEAAAQSVARQDDTLARKSKRSDDIDSSDSDKDDRAVIGVVTDNAGDDAHKVLRAVRRAEHGGTRTRYCFFDTTYEVPESSKMPKIRGPWRILTLGDVLEREQHITSGLPQALMEAAVALPPELFHWMLDEICVQSSSLCRSEYCSLLAQCPPRQLEQQIMPSRVEQLLLRLGASKDLHVKDSEITSGKQAHDSYPERNWACLSSFMNLIGSIATSLNSPTVIYSAQALLRLSMDPIILQAPGLLADYQEAIIHLVNAIAPLSWDSFCYETSLLLQTLVRPSNTRLNVLLCLPLHDTRTHELRRRFAIAFLFDDADLARGHPAQAVTMRDLINRLHGSEFTIRPKTDFLDLQSNILFLDAAVDDESFWSADAGDEEEQDPTSMSPEAEKAFNEEVDELADRLRAIWRKINDSGLKLPRTEAKGVIEWVQQRLAHLVRTRKKLRKSIFDMDLGRGRPGGGSGHIVNDPFLPKQQDYMKNFLQKSKSIEPK